MADRRHVSTADQHVSHDFNGPGTVKSLATARQTPPKSVFAADYGQDAFVLTPPGSVRYCRNHVDHAGPRGGRPLWPLGTRQSAGRMKAT